MSTQMCVYKCPSCEKSFKNTSGFQKHSKKVHGTGLKATEHKVTTPGSKRDDVEDNVCQWMDSDDENNPDCSTEPVFSTPAAVYQKDNLKNDLPALVIEALQQIKCDNCLTIPGSVYGFGIVAIANDVITKVKSGDTFSNKFITDMTSNFWNTIISGDKERTFSLYNEAIWHHFYNMWIDEDLTETVIDDFRKLCNADAENAQLFRTARMFLFRLIVLVRNHRDRSDGLLQIQKVPWQM
ncbi:uncharacterized protein LOC102806570 [Saccoglossus kowalevskii]|uniref:Uncharacterized protein LOC102806570 n=1 Tax=Saccoglossus kowalevskii TaxID=10224 RepID=A0ABM0LVI3_SACKO|nr:PREDICTED: uncharacterized protein LOC102806570 [Saccoglossus kowalevskii]